MTYDGLNRNTSVKDAGGKITAYAYNSLTKISRTDALGRQTTYGYDQRQRLTSTTYVGLPADDRTLSYDGKDNLLLVQEPHPNKEGKADVAYAYDALGR